MGSSRYSTYTGKFNCHVCKDPVTSLRHYPEVTELTWMCGQNHLTKVQLTIKKTKRDYEREI